MLGRRRCRGWVRVRCGRRLLLVWLLLRVFVGCRLRVLVGRWVCGVRREGVVQMLVQM